MCVHTVNVCTWLYSGTGIMQPYGPEKSDLIIEVAALFLTSLKQPRNSLHINDHFIQVLQTLRMRVK